VFVARAPAEGRPCRGCFVYRTDGGNVWLAGANRCARCCCAGEAARCAQGGAVLVRLTSQPAAVNRQLIDQQHLLVHLFLGEENHLLSNGGGLDPLNTHARNQLADSPHFGVGACPLAVPFFPATFQDSADHYRAAARFQNGSNRDQEFVSDFLEALCCSCGCNDR